MNKELLYDYPCSNSFRRYESFLLNEAGPPPLPDPYPDNAVFDHTFFTGEGTWREPPLRNPNKNMGGGEGKRYTIKE